MGLLARPNDDAKNVAVAQRLKAADVDIVELFDIPNSDELREQKRQRRCPLNQEEQKYIAKCMSKYGEDYGKAFWKLNYMQHTETQLRKMGARFLLLNEEQRVIELPEKVKPLMQGMS
jgi:hypothetical protein